VIEILYSTCLNGGFFLTIYEEIDEKLILIIGLRYLTNIKHWWEKYVEIAKKLL